MKGERIAKVRALLSKSPVVDIGSLERLVGDPSYTHLLMNYLVRRGEAKRLTRGYYTVYEDPALLVLCLKPAYLGLQDALSIHGVWEQETVPIIVTCRRVRVGIRTVLGQNVLVRRVSGRYWFGYEHMKVGDFLLPVSDLEKTFIDLVYFGEMREELARRFRGRLKRGKLIRYLEWYPRRFRKRVLGFLSKE